MEKLRRRIIGKGFPIFAFKKKKNLCVILNVVPWGGGESHLISILLVSMEIYMGKSIGMKVANDQISILQRLFRG